MRRSHWKWSVPSLLALAGYCGVAPAQTVADVDQVFRRYAAASGGEEVIRRVQTRFTVGELITGGGNRAPLETYQAAPDRFLRVLRNTQVKLSEIGFDGATGWSRNDEARRVVTGAELDLVRRDNLIHRPLEVRSFYHAVRLAADTVLDGTAATRVEGTTADGKTETLYFDRATGLLLGWDAVVNGTAIATRLEDYRGVDGVQVPFRVRRTRPGFTWSEQAREVRQNVPIEVAKFVAR